MTSDALAALIALAGSPRPPERPVAQAVLEAVYGRPLPADYGHYVWTVPPGIYRDTLVVAQPDGDGSTAELEAILEFRRGVLGDDEAPEELLPWAGIGRDYAICWVTGEADPDRWQTAVWDPYDGPTVHRFAGGCVEFVLAFANGTTGLPLLDHVYRREVDPLFVAFDYRRSLPPATPM